MKFLLLAMAIYLTSCNSQPNIETLVKKYMTDSIVPQFNDPASYQFVSMKADTFKGLDYLKNIKDFLADTSLLSKETAEENKKEFSKLSAIPGYADSVLNIQIQVNYRGKNKMGAMILDNLKLRYYPKENKFVQF